MKPCEQHTITLVGLAMDGWPSDFAVSKAKATTRLIEEMDDDRALLILQMTTKDIFAKRMLERSVTNPTSSRVSVAGP